MQLIIALRNYMLTSNIWIEKERARTQVLRIVTWHFLSTRAHNYVKIAVSKEIYTKLTENVQNPRCTSHTTQRAEDRYPPHYSALIHANPQQRTYGIRQQKHKFVVKCMLGYITQKATVSEFRRKSFIEYKS